jgi:hypothetical protein
MIIRTIHINGGNYFMYVFIYLFKYMHIFICIFICTYTYTCIYIHIYIYIYICICKYLHILGPFTLMEKIVLDLSIPWSKNEFKVNDILYGKDLMLCTVLESAIWVSYIYTYICTYIYIHIYIFNLFSKQNIYT